MSNIEDVLVDVRKAYRLLHVFNSRIIDLMKYIETAFGMEFAGGMSLFTADTPGNWKYRFNNWVWDFFNLYCYQFRFNSNTTWLSVILQSDTGLWDKIKDFSDPDEFDEKQDKVDLFNSPEDSKTRIFFVTGNGKWSEDKIQILYEKNLNKNIENDGVLDKGKRGKIWYKMFEISKFIDEETTLKTLDEFIGFLSFNDFNKIKIVKKGSTQT